MHARGIVGLSLHNCITFKRLRPLTGFFYRTNSREVNPKMKFMEINHLQIKLEDHQKRGILAHFFFKSVEWFKSYDHF
jgi:hypothetical protein